MLAYAFRVLKQSNYSQVATEDFENIHNLLAAILSKGISQQLKQGLYKEYVDKYDDEMLKEFSTILNRISGVADEMSSYFRRIKTQRELNDK